MKIRFAIVMTVVIGLFLGAYFWRVKNTGKKNFLEIDLIRSTSQVKGEDVLAEVGNESIFRKDLEFEKYIINRSGDKEGMDSRFDKRILHSAIERKILYKFALQDNSFYPKYDLCTEIWKKTKEKLPELLSVDKERLKTRICEQFIIDQYSREKLFKIVDLHDEELLKYYQEHQSTFQLSAQAKFRQIVLSTESDAKWVQERVSKHNFSQMAHSHSVTPESKNGGNIGPIGKGGLPQVFEPIFTLPLGKPSGIFKSTYGFHIFIVDERLEARMLSFTEVKGRIKNILIQEKHAQEFKEWADIATYSVQSRILRSI